MGRRGRREEGLLDAELLDECSHGASFHGQALVRPHERTEVVTVEGRDVLRRCGIEPCPDHLDAIRRARAYSEDPTRFVNLKTTVNTKTGGTNAEKAERVARDS